MFVVVGSGPAGIACARALLDRGHRVVLVDAGITLEPEKERLVRPMKGQAPQEWSPDALTLLRNAVQPTASGLPRKPTYGSLFPYLGADETLGVERSRVACVPSFARGGMSNVWGASILPYRDDDIADWPVRASGELAPHYRAVLSFVPHSAVRDRLEDVFPTYSECRAAIPSSPQALDLLRDLESSASTLTGGGIVFGRSRLAVDPGCIRCGLCMYGCPKEFVFNAASELSRLIARPEFTYRSGIVVERVREHGGQAIIEMRALAGGQRERLSCERAFLACGPIATTSIMLASLEAFDRELVLRDSQYYMFPMLRYEATREYDTASVHTLAQVFLEILDPAVSPYSVHVQLYSYNDLYQRVFANMLGPMHRRLPLGALLSRMWIAQGYLHSSLSPGISTVLTKPSASRPSRLLLQATRSPRTRSHVRRVLRKLWSARGSLRMVPLAPALKLGDAGQGYHVGGAFPMRASPGPFESDVLGRPHGFERVHLVDATTFPSIPASTVTLTVLANAHRIGTIVGA
jgi:choline dehydrogenase-like flavoprotein